MGEEVAYIDTAGLNHDEVALLPAGSGAVKGVKGSVNHLQQRGLILGGLAVNLIAEIACSCQSLYADSKGTWRHTIVEETQPRERDLAETTLERLKVRDVTGDGVPLLLGVLPEVSVILTA